MKKVLMIGKTGSGKTTLCQKMHSLTPEYRKTQAVEFFDHAIDTPGEYLENRGYYSALMVTACEADVIALVVDPTAEESFLPPGFAGAFGRPVIGIMTKAELVTDEAQRAKAEAALKNSGVREIFVVDTISGRGLAALWAALG